jgi:hypothetical protein
VTESWVIDTRDGAPDLRPPAFYHLVDGAYRPIPLDADGRLRSTVVDGFWLRPTWLSQDSPPNALECLAEIAPDALHAALKAAAAKGGSGA